MIPTNPINNYLKKHGFKAFHPKAALFDMDGVLFNSMPSHAESWYLAMKECGLRMTRHQAYLYEGMRGVETIKMKAREQWGRDISDAEAKIIYAVKTQYFSKYQPIPKMDGVEDIMKSLKKQNIKIGVVTGSGQTSLLNRLVEEFPGLIERKNVTTSFDVTRGKPQPDPYLTGLKKLHMKPWQAIVIENAPLGVQSAAAAGIFCIAVNTGPLGDYLLWKAGANIVVHSMFEAKALLDDLTKVENTRQSGKPQNEKAAETEVLPIHMTRDERWNHQLERIKDYIKKNKHNPSKHKREDAAMISWLKYNKKVYTRGLMLASRRKKFESLLKLMKKAYRVNQWSPTVIP